MDKRDSFVFYRSFYEAAALLGPEDRLAIMTAICEYALNGKAPELSGAAAALFLLAKPNLDANRRKYENGKKNGKKSGKAKSKLDAGREQTGANGDVDENANENGDEAAAADADMIEKGLSSAAAAVELAYRKKINPMLSDSCLHELHDYAERMGEACCLRAIDAALDAGKTSWSYVRAILRDKDAKGVRSLAEWDALEERRRKRSSNRPMSWAELAQEMEEEKARRAL